MPRPTASPLTSLAHRSVWDTVGALGFTQSTSMQSSSLRYCSIILFLPWGGKVSLWENEESSSQTISPGTEAQRAKGNTVSFSFPLYGQEEYPVTFRAWRHYGQTSELSRTRIKVWIILSEGVFCTREQNKTELSFPFSHFFPMLSWFTHLCKTECKSHNPKFYL